MDCTAPGLNTPNVAPTITAKGIQKSYGYEQLRLKRPVDGLIYNPGVNVGNPKDPAAASWLDTGTSVVPSTGSLDASPRPEQTFPWS
jgi:hypothetical protein